MNDTMQLTGARELEQLLKQLGSKNAKKVMRKAVRAGAKPILAEAKALAPVDTGALKRSLKLKAIRMRRDRSAVGISVATAKGWFIGDQFYAAFKEFGTSHEEAKPFVRPAFDKRKGEALQTLMDVAAKGIVDAAASSGGRP